MLTKGVTGYGDLFCVKLGEPCLHGLQYVFRRPVCKSDKKRWSRCGRQARPHLGFGKSAMYLDIRRDSREEVFVKTLEQDIDVSKDRVTKTRR